VILQALYQLAGAETLIGDPDFERKPVSWVVELAEDGRFIQIADHRSNLNEGEADKKGKPLKPKWVGKSEEVPLQPGRTSGDLAFAFVDKSEYALGFDPAAKRPAAKLKTRAGLFRQIVLQCAAETEDPAVRIVAGFLSELSGGGFAPLNNLPEDLAANDMIAFRVGEDTRLVHQRPMVRAWWKVQCEPMAANGEARFGCLVSGAPVDEPGLVPLIKPVPGGTPSGVALVSFNTGAFESYGLASNENAPITRAAAQRVATAFNRLLNARPVNANGEDLSPRRITLSSNTVLIYWSPDGEPNALDAMANLLEASSSDAVADLYRSVWRGRMPKAHDQSRFYAAAVTGTQGRAIIRGYIDTTVEAAMQSLAKHFADLSIVRNAGVPKGQEPSPAIPLRAMLDALAAPGRDASLPASLAADIVQTALDSRLAYPISAMQRALLRERAEAGEDGWIAAARRDARAAVIKAVIVRHHDIPLEIAMNPATESDGYQLGMLTAVLERLQAIALDNVNATLVDRFFAAASATPAAVFPRLLKLARHHARKAAGSESRNDQAMAFRYERIIDAISERFHIDPRRYPQPPGAFPNYLSLTEQGLFVLGYHQMRHWLWMNKEGRLKWEQEHSNAPPAFLWESRKAEKTDEPVTA
jgi:CRISPR-associated protein Csd1